jgi:hypothetical protein
MRRLVGMAALLGLFLSAGARAHGPACLEVSSCVASVTACAAEQLPGKSWRFVARGALERREVLRCWNGSGPGETVPSTFLDPVSSRVWASEADALLDCGERLEAAEHLSVPCGN